MNEQIRVEGPIQEVGEKAKEDSDIQRTARRK